MADRFKTIDLTTGDEIWREGLDESAGAGDAGKIPALSSDGKLHASLLPAIDDEEVIVAPSSETLSAGSYVNLWWDGSDRKARLADSGNGRPADGFVKATVTSPANATIHKLGTIDSNRTSLTPGAVYFLGAAGDVVADISGYGTGDLVQRIGRAISATEILTEQNIPAEIE